jgi:hypothetical protein
MIFSCPPSMYNQLLKVSKATGQDMSGMVREALYARYGKDVDPCADEMCGYVPPPTEEDFKWYNERSKALLDMLHKDLSRRNEAIGRVVDKYAHKKKLTIKEMVEIQDLEKLRPKKDAGQVIKEWDAETLRQFEKPEGRELARRYLHQLVAAIDWLRRNNSLDVLIERCEGKCNPRIFHEFTHPGKAADFYLKKASNVLRRWAKSKSMTFMSPITPPEPPKPTEE